MSRDEPESHTGGNLLRIIPFFGTVLAHQHIPQAELFRQREQLVEVDRVGQGAVPPVVDSAGAHVNRPRENTPREPRSLFEPFKMGREVRREGWAGGEKDGVLTGQTDRAALRPTCGYRRPAAGTWCPCHRESWPQAP